MITELQMITDLQSEVVVMIYYLLHFLTNSLVYLTVTSFGSAIAHCMDLYIRKRKNRSKSIILYAIIPAILITCIKEYGIGVLGERSGNTVLFGMAFLMGIAGEQLSKVFSDIRNLIPIYNNIIKIISSIRHGDEIKNLEKVDFSIDDDEKSSTDSNEEEIEESDDEDKETKNTT